MTTNLNTEEPNPFALMMDPEAVFARIAASERLSRLKGRICRPLDKPVLGVPDEEDEVESPEEIVSEIDLLAPASDANDFV